MKIKLKTLKNGLRHEVMEIEEWREEVGSAGHLEKVLKEYVGEAQEWLRRAIEVIEDVEKMRKEG